MQRSRAYTYQVWAGPSSLAATEGVEVSLLSCGYLDGSVPRVPHGTLWIHVPLMEGYSMPFPDLGDPRIKACLRLPEDYRSLATSFFGSWCQGIPTCTHGSLTKFSLEIVSRTSLSLTPHCQRPSPSLLESPRTALKCERATGSGPAARRVFSFTQAQANQRGRSLSTASFAPARCARPITRAWPMETDGIEPTTFWLQTRCSTN